jgi:hypothetical protein
MVALADVVWGASERGPGYMTRHIAQFRDPATGEEFRVVKWSDGDTWFGPKDSHPNDNRKEVTEFELACLIAPLTQEVSDA